MYEVDLQSPSSTRQSGFSGTPDGQSEGQEADSTTYPVTQEPPSKVGPYQDRVRLARS